MNRKALIIGTIVCAAVGAALAFGVIEGALLVRSLMPAGPGGH